MPTPEWPIRDEPPGMDLQADPPGDDMPPQGPEASSCNYPIDNATSRNPWKLRIFRNIRIILKIRNVRNIRNFRNIPNIRNIRIVRNIRIIRIQEDPPGDVMPPQGSEATSCNYPIDNNNDNVALEMLLPEVVVTTECLETEAVLTFFGAFFR